MSELSLMERFADPELIGQLTVGEKAIGSSITMLMGMGVTFIILFLLWGCIAVMSRFIGTADPKSAAGTAAPAVPAPAVVETTTENNGELVAVISAAVAAAEGSCGMSNLVVTKINRITGEMPTWAVAGRGDCAESRKLK